MTTRAAKISSEKIGSEQSCDSAVKEPTDCGVSAAVDVEAIMTGIRRAVKLQSDSGDAKPLRYCPPAERLFDGAPSSILYCDELNYLNAQWNSWAEKPTYSTHRKFIGPLIVRGKKLIRDFLWHSVFASYFEKEREFQMQLVRFLNATARYVDSRDSELFWQLVKKIDSDVASINERMDLLHDSTQLEQVRLANSVELLNRNLVQLNQVLAAGNGQPKNSGNLRE